MARPLRWLRSESPTAVAGWGFLGSLIGLWAIGLLGLWIVPARASRKLWMPPIAHLLAPFARWDSAWYYRIAAIGYWRKSAYAFFPLYPALMRAVHTLTGWPYVLSGEAIGWVAEALALYLLARLWLEEAGPVATRRAMGLLLAYPAAFFLVAMYPESLYLLFSVATYLMMRRGRWGLASVMMALGAVARANGILLLIPYLAFAWEKSGRRLDGVFWRRAALSLVPIAALGLYAAFSAMTTGNPLQFLAQQATWHRHFTGGAFALAYALIHILYGQGVPLTIVDFLAPLAFLGVIALDRKTLSLGDRLYVFFGVLSILVDPSVPNAFVMMSATRLVMPYFPVFLAVARRLSPKQWRYAMLGMGVLQLWFWLTYTHFWFSG